MFRAGLSMYDMLAPVRQANDELWRAIRARLSFSATGNRIPENLDRQTPYDEIWLKPDLLLAQACGFPFVKLLSGKVKLVGTPVYSFDGGFGADRASFVIARSDDPRKELKQFRGSRAVINDRLSNSGMNLFRAAISEVAGGEPFFADVRLSGGHMASIAMVKDKQADVASIDSVTWGMVRENDPALLDGLKIVCQTPAGPGLPFITRGTASASDVEDLRHAVTAAIADRQNAHATETLGLVGLEILTEEKYARLLELEVMAVKAGYPELA